MLVFAIDKLNKKYIIVYLKLIIFLNLQDNKFIQNEKKMFRLR